jgi:hypothetical protein
VYLDRSVTAALISSRRDAWSKISRLTVCGHGSTYQGGITFKGERNSNDAPLLSPDQLDLQDNLACIKIKQNNKPLVESSSSSRRSGFKDEEGIKDDRCSSTRHGCHRSNYLNRQTYYVSAGKEMRTCAILSICKDIETLVLILRTGKRWIHLRCL